MKKKNLVSLSISLAFLTLSATGLLLYIKKKPHFVEMTHTIFGLLFIAVAIFHIVNNWASLKSYLRDKNNGSIRKELIVSVAVIGLLIVLSVTEVLEPVAEFGRIFVPKGGEKKPSGITFEEKTTLDSTSGTSVTLILQKTGEDKSGALTVQVADTTGKVLETLIEGEDKDGPKPNLILHSKISTPAPFKILISSTYEGEAKRQESLITALTPGAQALTSASPAVQRAILEVR
jgi:hypothetical protein